MKKIYRTMLLCCMVMLLVACGDTSLKRADKNIGLMQDDMTSLINDLNEIQLLENNLQSDFEETLAQSSELAIFTKEDSPIAHNIQQRQKFLLDIDKKIKNLTVLIQELTQLKDSETLPMSQFSSLQQKIATLKETLDIYVMDYQANLAVELTSFQSIANPESDYSNFFGVLKNINALSTTNSMNLEKVIPSFEPINIQLINVKVALVKMLEK